MRRVCIYLGDSCNLNCVYCLRNNPLACKPFISSPSEKLLSYLSSRTPDFCDAVVMNGGEPLLYFDLIKDLFSYVPADVHKKIISNGTLLTQDIINYINSNYIELCLSHDGEQSSFLRGVDVLTDPYLLSLINQVNDLSISCTITNRNCDVYANYSYIKHRLIPQFHFLVNVVLETGSNSEYVDDFNYDLFQKSYLEFMLSRPYYSPHYPPIVNEGRNVLLNGDIVTLDLLTKVGDVFDCDDKLLASLETLRSNCSVDCPIIGTCRIPKQNASEHFCKKEIILSNVSDYINLLKEGYL